MRTLFSLSGTLLMLQLTAVTASLVAIAFYPPASGTMTLIPLWPGAEQGLTARAVEAGARLVDRGPLPGSLVITGERAALVATMLSHGILIINGPKAGCGVPA